MKIGIVIAGAEMISFIDVEDTEKIYEDIVGGSNLDYIELSPVLGVYYNQEGKLQNLKQSLAIFENDELHDVISGDCFFIGTDGEGFNTDLNDIDMRKLENSIRYEPESRTIEIEVNKL